MEKKNTSLIITIIILVICVIGLSGYIVYDKVYMNKQNDTSNIENKDNKPIDNKLSNEEVEKIGKRLYDETSIKYGQDYYYFYNKENISYEDISTKDRMIVIIETMDKSKKSIDDNAGYNDFNQSVYNVKPIMTIAKKDFAEKYYEIFGLDKKINYTEFDHIFSDVGVVHCYNDNENIYCVSVNGGDAFGPYGAFIKYDKTELNNNDLFVYSKVLSYKEDDENKYTYSGFYQKRLGVYVTESDMWKDYTNMAQEYKLTFKQDTNGNYYWYSTELV